MKVERHTPDANNTRFPLQVIGHSFRRVGGKIDFTVLSVAMTAPPNDADVGFWMARCSRPGSVIAWIVPVEELTDEKCWRRVP